MKLAIKADGDDASNSTESRAGCARNSRCGCARN